MDFDTKNDDKLELELAHEEAMLDSGKARYRKEFNKANASDRFSSTLAGSKILDKNVMKVERLINEWKQKVEEGVATYGIKAYAYLKDIPSGRLALITSKAVLNAVTRPQRFTTLSCSLGKAVEQEERFCKFREENPHYVSAVVAAYNKRSSSSQYRVRSLNNLSEQKGLEWESWPDDVHAHVGYALIQKFIEATALVEVVTAYSQNRTVDMIQPSKGVLEWIKDFNETQEELRPKFLPMLCPPKPWTSPMEGGYYHEMLQRPIVKSWGKRKQRHLLNTEMPIVLEAVNAIQETEWVVNTRVLEVMKTCWLNGVEAEVLPSQQDIPVPPCPLPKGLSTDKLNAREKLEFEAWKAKARAIRNANAESRGKRIQTDIMLGMAETFKGKSIWFPHNLDYRGRVYPIPSGLSPQGSDPSKALIMFANGAVIYTPAARCWLAIHGANSYGVDKVSFAERVQWVEDNTKAIKAIAEDPYENKLWQEADSPWQFLAWCLEWADMLKNPETFLTRIPVALDGSCNGLQHFAAMLRDAEGGASVNLVPNEKPSDIYQIVCDSVKEDLKDMIPKGAVEGNQGKEVRMAKKWLNWDKTTRKLTKRPVMIVPYGGTSRATFEYTLDYLEEHAKTAPFKDLFEASHFISKLIWKAVGEKTESAQKVMSWLQGVARACNKLGEPIEWVTPTGFPVHMANMITKSKQLEIKLFDKVYRPRIPIETQEIDKAEQVNGISPNFVHSLDASALVLYVQKAKKEGIINLAMIHDSYGTTADKTQLASQLLREAFVELYEKHDVLAEFKTQMEVKVKQETPPEKGSLDLSLIKNAPYFFA